MNWLQGPRIYYACGSLPVAKVVFSSRKQSARRRDSGNQTPGMSPLFLCNCEQLRKGSVAKASHLRAHLRMCAENLRGTGLLLRTCFSTGLFLRTCFSTGLFLRTCFSTGLSLLQSPHRDLFCFFTSLYLGEGAKLKLRSQ